MAGSNAAAGLEESIWLCPMEDRSRVDSAREGMLEGFSLGNYLLLVDYTGRLFRDGKAVISAELSGILERLGSSAASSVCICQFSVVSCKGGRRRRSLSAGPHSRPRCF